MIYLNFLAIAIIEVFIIDLSGAIEHLVKPIVRKLLGISQTANINIPLISCSLCVVFWTGLIYLLSVGEFTVVNFLFTSLVSFFTPNIAGFLIWIKEFLVKIENLLYKLIH